MCKDTIENTVVAVLSFLLGLYFGADYADYFLSSVPYQAFLPHFPKVSAIFGSIRCAAAISDSAAGSSPLRRSAMPRP